jgi:hypothetical protein
VREDSSGLPCKSCGKGQATHICEGCGSVLCAECLETRSSRYIICSECHHSLGVPPPGEEFTECPECQSHDLSVGRRVEEICPRCHSSQIMSLEEKRRGLAQDLRRAVMNIHHGHTKLREFNNRLIASKRLLVSLRMANFLHYKWLEDNIETLHGDLGAIKNRVMDQAEIVAKRIAADTKGLIDHTTWVPSQFPFIEGVTNRVTQIVEQYKADVDDSLVDIKRTLDETTSQLEGLDYYRKQFADFYENANLQVSELPVCAIPNIKVLGSDFLRHDKATGTLYVTNKRLIFMAEVGLVRRKREVVFDFPLMYLDSIEEDGRIRKRMVLKMKQGELKIACTEQTQKVLPDYIEIARKFERYQQTDLQRVRKLEQAGLNISDVRMKIEGLVYALLTPQVVPTDTRPQPYTSQPRSQLWGRGVPQRGYGEYRPGMGDLRRELEETLPRTRGEYGPRRGNEYGYGTEPLLRGEREVRAALNETIDLLRSGRIVPEDFIRRYRGLMRESYQSRMNGDRTDGSHYDSRW